MIDKFTLISGEPYKLDDVVVYPPTLRDIRAVSYERYQLMLSILLMTKEDILKLIGAEEAREKIEFDVLQLITLIPEFRSALLQALSFFLRQEVRYSDDVGYFVNDESTISLERIWEIRKAIVEFCHVEDPNEDQNVTFYNEKAKKVWEKIQKRKAAQKKQKQANDRGTDLANLIGAVCAYSNTYNLLNIWDLTIYQFYDQFARLDTKIQMGVYGQRWAAWGKDDFDFSLWRRALDNS